MTPEQGLIAKHGIGQGLTVGIQLSAFLASIEGKMEARRARAKVTFHFNLFPEVI